MKLVIFGGIAYTVGMILFSIFILQPARPIIDIKGEKLIHVASFGSEMLDFNITNTLFTAWVTIAVMLIFCFFCLRGKALQPAGLYNFFESIIELIYDFVVGIVGEHNGRRFFPLVATLLLYIVFGNWLSLTPVFNTIGVFEPATSDKAEFHERAVVFKEGSVSLILPGSKNIQVDAAACDTMSDEQAADACRESAIEQATSGKVDSGEKAGVLAPYLRGVNTDLMTPLSYALVVMFMVQYWGVSSQGFFRYFKKFIDFSSPLNFFVGILETIAEFAKVISFSFRLFGNMLAGEILLLVMTFLVAVASPIIVVFYSMELFVGAIQAFIFGALALVFGLVAVTHHGSEANHAPEQAPEH